MKKLPFAALLLGMALSATAQADWATNFAAQIGNADDPAVAYLSASSPVAVFSRVVDGAYRIYALLPGASAPVLADEGIQADHRRPVIVPDGAGNATLIYSRITGEGWHIFARRLENGVFSDLNGGAPIDAFEFHNALVSSAAYLGNGALVVAYLQNNGLRTALFASMYSNGTWMAADHAIPIDDTGAGPSGSVALASMPDGTIVAAFTQVVDGDMRLFAVSVNGIACTRLNGGMALDGDNLSTPTRVSVAARPDGKAVVTYLEEDANAIQRIYAVVLDGQAMVRVNAGAPLDASVNGVNSAASAAVGGKRVVVVYGTSDQAAGNEPPAVRSLLIDGTAVSMENSGVAIHGGWEGSPAEVAVAGLSSGQAVMLFNVGTDTVPAMMGRTGDFAAAAADGAMDSGALSTNSGSVSTVNSVFKPEHGETLRVVTTVGRTQRVKLSLYTLSGGLVRVLDDCTVCPGGRTAVWDGRNGLSERVASGVYLLVAQGDTFHSTNKVVVIR
jgi:hypothetical protein